MITQGGGGEQRLKNILTLFLEYVFHDLLPYLDLALVFSLI